MRHPSHLSSVNANSCTKAVSHPLNLMRLRIGGSRGDSCRSFATRTLRRFDMRILNKLPCCNQELEGSGKCRGGEP